MIWRILYVILALALIVFATLAVVAVTNAPIPEHPFFAQDGPMVIAHQGGELLRPSNTMAAFTNAVELGVDVLEMDIHATADNVIVLMHDATVDRTTDGTGEIKTLSLGQIKQLDAGYYWTEDGGQTYPYRGQGIQVPTLEEVFRAFPDMRMNIEIKQQEPSIVRPFCELIRAYGMGRKVLVASFHQETMQEFRERCPGVATSMVESEIRTFYILNRIGLGFLYRSPGHAFQVPEKSGDLQIVTLRFVEGAAKRNIKVHVWTINETEDMARLLEAGVAGIITDRPDRLLELLGR